MKYRELVSFEPLETVKELRAADDEVQALEDVRTFVISDRMADQLTDLLVPHLRFDEPHDNKGLFVVANYGTGKTHFMSVVAAIAERAHLLSELRHEGVRDAAGPISGRFQVIRAEIGATGIDHLRDVVVAELTKGLKRLGVEYRFPDFAEVTNTKDALVAMMEAFESVYPDHGLLFVLDELLDYLSQLRDAQLIQSLAFLREVGEICRSTRFRFLSGVQEAIFDNPRFAGAADAVRRVRDRFEQVRISREDVAFVVQERLLGKTAEQRQRIRDHLQQFTPLYEGMSERLDDFVRLYPVHPAYLRTFERITAVEKRTVLKALSQEMLGLLDTDVPDDEPGMVCYDSYRARLEDDPSFRMIPEVREVLDKSGDLRSKIEQSLPEKQYVGVALRIIDALAIHRLTTEDIHAPMGLTVENLRDDLTLLPPGLPKLDSRFLVTTIKSIVSKVMTTVSGQFLTENPSNGQIYLDVAKDVDYDQRIAERATHLDDERLDDGYFRALEELLEVRDDPYVASYRIWQYEIEWAARKVTRIGYLFMGAPNERSTAQPPRDFYIYFLQPYDEPKFADDKNADEVFFRLANPDEEFTLALRRYAGAAALERESAGVHRNVYGDKRELALRAMVSWLRQHMGTAMSVTYKGARESLSGLTKMNGGREASLKESLDTIAAGMLAARFEERYPGYPTFGVTVTAGNLSETVRQALSYVSGRPTQLGRHALDGLDLLQNDGIVADGQYARGLLATVDKTKPKVVNKDDILCERDRGLPTWAPWHLEPAWLVVVAAALAQLGKVEIGYGKRQIDALGIDELVSMPLEELESFTHFAPPRATPIQQLQEVSGILDLKSNVVPTGGFTDAALREILDAVASRYEEVTIARTAVADRTQLWGEILFDRPDERDRRLEGLQTLLEDLKGRNTVGKMNRLALTEDTLLSAREGQEELRAVNQVIKARGRLTGVAEYLR